MEWNIQSRGHVCVRCQAGFKDGLHYHSTLVPDGALFARQDFCEPCWRERAGEAAAVPYLSHWQGTYEAPPPAPPDAIQKESAETLLRKLIERGEARFAPACFILAAMLERKRILKVKGQVRDAGRRYFVYEHAKSGDAFTILDPELQLAQLESVQRDVASLLESGIPEEAPSQPVEEPFNPSSDVNSLAPA